MRRRSRVTSRMAIKSLSALLSSATRSRRLQAEDTFCFQKRIVLF
jgi:hypothetical protein